MNDLDEVLNAAEAASPGERIEFRDRIAAFGAQAIPPLGRWLLDPRLGAFAVRTLERIGRDTANRQAVLDTFVLVPQSIPEPVATDLADALGRLRGRRPSSDVGGKPRPRTPIEPWPGTRNVSALELQFHDDIVDVFRLAGEATRRPRPDGTTARGYWASYFLRGVRNHGGLDYAHQLLRQEGTTDGFRRLTEEGRLDHDGSTRAPRDVCQPVLPR